VHTLAAVAFRAHLIDDLARLVECAIGLFLGLVCVRVAWLRAKSPVGDRRRDSSPWAILSYGIFAFVPALGGLSQFGHPLKWVNAALYGIAVGCGLVATFAKVTIHLWTGREDPPVKIPLTRGRDDAPPEDTDDGR
jgi:hypothetical protein